MKVVNIETRILSSLRPFLSFLVTHGRELYTSRTLSFVSALAKRDLIEGSLGRNKDGRRQETIIETRKAR